MISRDSESEKSQIIRISEINLSFFQNYLHMLFIKKKSHHLLKFTNEQTNEIIRFLSLFSKTKIKFTYNSNLQTFFPEYLNIKNS